MKESIVSILLLIQVLLVTAQTGTIKGNVTDAKTKESLIGTTVFIKGTTQGSITDFDGNYMITKVEPGKYTLAISFISYDTQEFDIEVKSNNETVINVELAPATLDIGEVQVVAKANRESENMLLIEQKNAVLAKQTIGAQEISRKGASDAEAAVTKMSGISKQEGVKNVFVRGLGDRFNSTTLNGFPVPSEDPEYKNISLDFFASEIIKAIGVSKVFNAGTTGDVAGAQIDISSKELMGEGELNVDVSAKANTQVINTDFLVPEGVSILGFAQNTSSPTSEESYDFKNSLDPSSQNFQVGKSFGIAGGKRYNINNNPLTFYIVGNYSNDFNYSDGYTRESTTDGTIFRDQNTKKYERESSHLAMANVNYRFKKNTLSYNSLLIHTAIEGLRDDYGENSEVFQEAVDYTGWVRRQQNNLNTLLVNQLNYKREINKRLSADAGVAFNYTNGKEPDRRVNYLSYEGDDLLSPLRGSGRQHRYFSDLKETDLNAIVKVKYKFSDDVEDISSVDFGYKGRMLHDDFNSNSWDNSRTQSTLPTLDLYGFSLDEIFNQEEFEAGHFKNDEYNVSSYSVDKIIHSIFSELNYQLGNDFFVNVGLKADLVNLKVDYDVNDGANESSHSLDKFYILPNLNLKYKLNENNALRFGASRTYTLPQSKEISPLLYEGPQWSSQGNPDIEPSTNYNVDLKWDFFPTNNELISVTVFGKLIQDPISKVEVNSAGGFLSYANIADEAKLAGIELEIRKNIFSKFNQNSNVQNKLSGGINFSYISTGIETTSKTGSSIPLNFTNDKTDLEGASPIIANADLSYNYQKEDVEFSASLIANYVSEHIYSIGVNGYNDVNESGIATLDFVSSYRMNKHWGIKLKAKNLLDPEFELTREASVDEAQEVVLRSYKKGISLSFGLSYQF
jgi:hypothetical protein